MKKLLLLTKTLLAVALLCVGQNAWGATETYDFSNYVVTENLGYSTGRDLTLTGDNIATADASTVKLVSGVSSGTSFDFGGRFAIQSTTLKFRNGNSQSKATTYKVNKGIQYAANSGTNHFSILNLKENDIVTITTGNGTTKFASTNAKVGGSQVTYNQRVGSDATTGNVGSTTVCTMTEDGNLDLIMEGWAVIMSVTINEPISATLDHTAGAQWGSNKGESTVDAEKEHYNKDLGNAWAGCAYAKFSFSIPAGHSIKSATLTYSVNQGGNSDRNDIIYYMAKDFDIDWATFAGQTGEDLRYTGSRAGKAVAAAPTGGTGDRLNLRQDVTSSVQAISDAGQDYIIFQWTGNDGGADLYGKGADAAKRPTLVIETAPPVSIAIEDCEAHETSSEFATAVEKESFASAAEVYAFHTAWQIAQADAASSNDITKVIFDAAVSDFTRWNNARSASNQQYTGAPDAKYFDAWNNDASDAKQKIYGLPAGTYTLKVATRASEDVTDKSKYNVWVNGGSANVSVLGSHIGSDGGSLGNGWNWTILSFTLSAKADVEIGFYSCPPTERWAGCDDFHLYKGMLAENVSVTISEAGYATLVSPYALDFTSTSIKAHTAVVDEEKGIVTLTQKNQIPSNTPVVLYCKGGKTEDVPVIAAADALGDNDLKAGKGLAVATGTNPYNYILNNVSGIGFYKAAGQIVDADRAYLQTTYNVAESSSARMAMRFAGNITGVANVEAAAEAKAQDGKFIENGKLVIVKNGQKFNAAGALIY